MNDVCGEKQKKTRGGGGTTIPKPMKNNTYKGKYPFALLSPPQVPPMCGQAKKGGFSLPRGGGGGVLLVTWQAKHKKMSLH